MEKSGVSKKLLRGNRKRATQAQVESCQTSISLFADFFLSLCLSHSLTLSDDDDVLSVNYRKILKTSAVVLTLRHRTTRTFGIVKSEWGTSNRATVRILCVSECVCVCESGDPYAGPGKSDVRLLH